MNETTNTTTNDAAILRGIYNNPDTWVSGDDLPTFLEETFGTGS